MGSKGQSTSNTQQSQTNTPAGAGYVQNALQQGQAAAATPFSQPVAPVAGFSQDQLSAFNTVNNAQGMAQPYFNQAAQDMTPQGTQAFLNPYASNVMAGLQNTFGEQQQQATGSLTQAAGGVGADRIAVGQADLANQQGLAAGQTLSSLYTGAAQQAQSAGYGQAAIGSGMENEALQGAQAQLGTGGLQQQLSQAQLNAPYQQQLAALAYPFQTAQFNAGITGALAPGLGGTTTGYGNTQSTPAPPSIYSQLLGLGAAGTGLAGGLGAFNGSGSKGASYGGGSAAAGDAYGGSASAPLPGLTAADYGQARGGRIYPHYADGGNVIPIHQPITPDIADEFHRRLREADSDDELHGVVKDAARYGVNWSHLLKARGGDVGYDDGGSTGLPQAGPYQVPQGFNNKPINVGPQSVVPGTQLKPIQGQQPHLSLSGSTPQPQQAPSASDITKLMSSTQSIGKLFGGSGSKRGGRIGYDEGGDVSDKPIDAAPQSVVPAEQLSQIQTQQPTLNLNPPAASGSGSSASSDLSSIASIAGTAAKIGAMFIKRGGRVDRGFDDGGNTDVINTDEPYRLAGPDAMDAWRKGDDASRALVKTDVPDGSAPPSELPPYITSGTLAPADGDQPYKALAFAPAGGSAKTTAATVDSDSTYDHTPTHTPVEGPKDPGFAGSPWAALMQAGLAIAGGSSPYAGVNIGKGGLEGLNTLEKQREAAQKDETVNQSAKRLQMEADQHADSMNKLSLYQQKQVEHLDKDKYVDAGSIMTKDGLHPAVREVGGTQIIDTVTGKPPEATDKYQPKGKGNPERAATIGEAIIRGEQPPVLTGLYGDGPAVKEYLAAKGFDQTKAMLEYSRAQKQVAALNGPQMTRYVGLSKSVDSTIDRVNDLSRQMELGGIPFMNRLELQKYIQTQGNSEKGQLATQYQTAVGTLKEEFANLANGGYAPTEPAWELANKQINGDYGMKQLGASLGEVQRLIRYRLQAIPNMDTLGPGAPNRYGGGQGTPAQQPAQTPAAPADPATLKAQGAAAIAHGAPRDAVIKQLQQQGVDTTGM